MMQNRTFYGKYRGIVTDIEDPLKMGRIRARVPDVMGNDKSGWALPNMPFAGDKMGFYALPKVNSRVWIEFEQGDPDYPIWSGCWWGSQSELPSVVSEEPYKRVAMITEKGHMLVLDDSGSGKITVQTAGGQKMVLDDGGGEITIQTANGQKIVMNATSIKIDNGSGATIEMSGPKVGVNNDALEVI